MYKFLSYFCCSGEENHVVNGDGTEDTPPMQKSEKGDKLSDSSEKSAKVRPDSAMKENGDCIPEENTHGSISIDSIGENTHGSISIDSIGENTHGSMSIDSIGENTHGSMSIDSMGVLGFPTCGAMGGVTAYRKKILMVAY